MKLICTIYIFCIISLFYNSSVYGQQKKKLQLTGVVKDITTGKPLVGATINLIDVRRNTVADSNGVYLFSNIPLGHTLVEVSYVGYATKEDHFDIFENTSRDFLLSSRIIENEGITITAVGSPISNRKTPVSIIKVSRQDLLSTSSTNIIDAISRQPGVSQVTTGPAISKPVIRGLGYNRLVVINDGLRQEGQQWGDEHGIEIDENSVNKIEIVKGPASIIYGSDALAGVINIVSNQPPQENMIKGNILTGYMTNNKQRTFYTNLGGNHKGFSWSAWGDYKGAADYSNKYDGKVFNSKFNEMNFGGYSGYNGKWGYSHISFSSFNQKLGVITGDRDSAGNLIMQLPGGNTELPTTADFNSIAPQIPYQHIRHLKFIADNSFRIGKGKLFALAGYQRNRRIEYGNADNPDEKNLYFDLGTVNYRLYYQFQEKRGWSTSAGVGGMWQQNINKGIELLIPEYGLFDFGSYLYSRKNIGNTTWSGGIRYDIRALHIYEHSENGVPLFTSFSRNFSNFSGSIGLSHELSSKYIIKANIARGFRTPNVPELSSNGAHEGTNRFEYGAINLKSEISWQGDVSLDISTDHLQASIGGFYNNINNFIFYSRLPNSAGTDSILIVNGHSLQAFSYGQRAAALYGIECKMDLHPHPFDWLHLESTFSYVKGSFKNQIDNTLNMPLIPAARLINEVRAELLKKDKHIQNLSLFIEWDLTFNQNQPFTAYGSETSTPGYSLLNTGLHFNMTHKKNILFSLYMIASNLTNVGYQQHMSRLKYTDVNLLSGRQGIFNMGQNFTIKLNIPLSF